MNRHIPHLMLTLAGLMIISGITMMILTALTIWIAPMTLGTIITALILVLDTPSRAIRQHLSTVDLRIEDLQSRITQIQGQRTFGAR